MKNYADLMFTDAVAQLQEAEGTRAKYKAFYPHRTQSALSADDIAFIQARESFYLATVNEDGWPYIQHRGGDAGFVKVVGADRLICADFSGNKQFISMGNLKSEMRVSLLFIDYMNKARLKVQGTATLRPLGDADPDDLTALGALPKMAERVLAVEIVAMDWNCPKYIPNLYPETAVQQLIATRMHSLTEENAALKSEIARLKGETP